MLFFFLVKTPRFQQKQQTFQPAFMASSVIPLFLFSFFLLNQPFARANLHKANNLLKSTLLNQLSTTQSQINPPPKFFFEVTKSIKLSKVKPCSHNVLRHDFAYTYGKSPVLANYTFPSHCTSQSFSKIVLEWKATSRGRQFDRIFGVWLGGVELLRSCTAEPIATGILWRVEKDVTRYSSLLTKNDTQTLAVYLGNLIDKTYTGIYHVDITFHFYPAEADLGYGHDLGNLVPGYGSNADLILPISRNLPLNDGLWFEVENSTDTESKEFKIPKNVYRAVLEVYVSFHENDEFWYGNFPNEYIAANNLSGVGGNGPFREVVVSLDNQVVGAVWPFPVVYTGGINPLLWRPISAIGSFDLPAYDIEITTFLGNLLDGETHKLGFSVTNASNVWYIDANLHLWLDSKSTNVEGKLLKHSSLPLHVSLMADFKGLNGKFLTNVSRSISSTGWVKSSHGKITTYSVQNFSYSNSMILRKDGNLQIVNQLIHFDDSVYAKQLSSHVLSKKSSKTFPLYLYSDYLDSGNGTYLAVANVTMGFYEKKKSKNASFGLSKSILKNKQDGQGLMVVQNNLVTRGQGSTQQVYKYHGNDFCYFRNVSSSNYTILYDKVRKSCGKARVLLSDSAQTNGLSISHSFSSI